MAGKKGSSQNGVSSYAVVLAEMLGGSSSLDLTLVDASLLWMAMVASLKKGASLSLSLTKSQKGMIITLWDGQFPTKFYPEGDEEVNKHLAGIVVAYCGGHVPAEWEAVIRQYWHLP